MRLPDIIIRLPRWVRSFLEKSEKIFPDMEDRMRFTIELSRQNVEHESGGPFAAAVFDNTGRLIAPGVNIVMTSNCSVFHAEITAIVLAQKILGRYDISDGGRVHYELYATTEPCAMCFGALPWSGIRQLVCGARDEDARAIGFDEGPKLKNWILALNERNIHVVRDVLREEAADVLRSYAKSGGLIYNPG
jgi:tRNA(Arg) A34 adenosine deaminase TadA